MIFGAIAAVAVGTSFSARAGDSVTARINSELPPMNDAQSAFAFTRADLFNDVEVSTLVERLPVVELLDGRRFPVTNSIGRMGMASLDFLPLAYYHAVDRRRPARADVYANDDVDTLAEIRSNPMQVHGEVGVFYGTSTGKYGGDMFGSYIIGTVGNDKVQVTAGASYQEQSFRFRGR